MKTNDYQKNIRFNKPADEVYKAITEHINDWWSNDIVGKALNKGDQYTISFGKTQKTFEIVEAIPAKQVIWLCLKAHINMAALGKKDEWVGTRLIWTITEIDKQSTLNFVHEGLNRSFECYDVCESGWDYFIDSLEAYLNIGVGTPYHKKEAVLEN